MNVQEIMSYLKNPKYFLIVCIFILIIVLSIIISTLQKRSLRSRLDNLEKQFNNLKTQPFAYKMKTTLALAKNNIEVQEILPGIKEKYDILSTGLESIGSSLTEADDYVYFKHHKKARNTMDQIEGKLDEINDVAEELLKVLNEINEKEQNQRATITKHKEKYRLLRSNYSKTQAQLLFAHEYLEKEFEEIGTLFSKFEDEIFASNIEQSDTIAKQIEQKINELENFMEIAPTYVSKINETKKITIQDVTNIYLQAVELGVVISHLDVNKNIDLINDVLDKNYQDICEGNIATCEESINDCVLRLNQLTQQIEREAKAYEQFNISLNEIEKNTTKEIKLMADFKISYEKNKERFGYDNWETFINNNISQLDALKGRIEAIHIKSDEKETPYTTLLITVKEYEESIKHMMKEISTLSDKLSMACHDERRAKEQVEKLYLSLQEIQVQLRKHHLPSISSNFEKDLRNGYSKLHVVEYQLDQTPLNIAMLNSTLEDAINYNYQLHNDVSQLIGSASMVENAIVYANKYRSAYPEVDSELTRAELHFSNGEFTEALTTSIQIIEKIHPGSYESLIRSQEMKG